MRAPGTVAALAADIPFRDLLGLDIVVHRVAAVACRSSRPLHVVRRIERFPPIASLWNKIRSPDFVGHVPLRGLGEIVIADFGEIALLPKAAIHKGDLLLRKFRT